MLNVDWKKEVKKKLVDKEWTLDRLSEEVTKVTGLYCSRSYLWHIFTGRRHPQKIIDAVNAILEIKEA